MMRGGIAAGLALSASRLALSSRRLVYHVPPAPPVEGQVRSVAVHHGLHGDYIDGPGIPIYAPDDLPTGADVGMVCAADAHAHDHTFTLDDDAGGRFTIIQKTGYALLKKAGTWTAGETYHPVVRATSGESSATRTATYECWPAADLGPVRPDYTAWESTNPYGYPEIVCTRSGTDLVVATKDAAFTGISVAQTFTSLSDLMQTAGAHGNAVIRLPATSDPDYIRSTGPDLTVNAHVVVIGATRSGTKAPDEPGTRVSASNISSTCFGVAPLLADAKYEFVNINVGATDAQVVEPDLVAAKACYNCLVFKPMTGGHVIFRNCRIAGANADGIEGQSAVGVDKDEILNRRYRRLWIIDCLQTRNCLGGGKKHGIYIHSSSEILIIRSVGGNSGNSVWKWDETNIRFLHCTTSDDLWGFSDPLNKQPLGDAIIVNDYFERGCVWSDARNNNSLLVNPRFRDNAFGGYQEKLPTYFKNQKKRYEGIISDWTDGANSETCGVRIAENPAAVAAGATSVTLDHPGAPFAFIYVTLSVGAEYDLKVIEAGSVTTYRATCTSFTDDGNGSFSNSTHATFALSSPTTIQEAVAAKTTWLITVASGNLARPKPNPVMHNPNDPDYYWAVVKNPSTGTIDETRAGLFHHYIMIDPIVHRDGMISVGYVQYCSPWQGYSGHQKGNMFAPPPPMNDPDGEWYVDYGWNVDWAGNGGLYPYWCSRDAATGGTGILNSDMDWPFIMAIEGGVNHPGGRALAHATGYTPSEITVPDPNLPVSSELQCDIRYYGATMTKITTAGSDLDVPASQILLTVAQNSAVGTSILYVTDASGVNVGDVVLVQFGLEPWKGGGAHKGTVTDINTASTPHEITLNNTFHRDVDLTEFRGVHAYVRPPTVTPDWLLAYHNVV